MKKLHQIAMVSSYYLGLLSLLIGIVLRFLGDQLGWIGHSPRGALVFAGALFLCTLASHVVMGGGKTS